MRRFNFISSVFLFCAGAALFALSMSARAEPAFNALGPDDPHYAEYRQNLCQGAAQIYNTLYAEKYWLDHLDPKLAAKTPAEREDWVINYAVTASLRETWRDRYTAHCGGGARHAGEYDDPGNASADMINHYEHEQEEVEL
jgi:hypothetical protein